MTDVKTSWDNLMTELRNIGNLGSIEPRYFKTLPERLPSLIRNLVLYDDSPSQEINLVHYTSFKNAMNMFSPDQDPPIFRMYNYELCNDPDEGQIRPEEWKEVEKKADWVGEFLKNDSRWKEEMELGGSTYGCSFTSGPSGVEDDLTYWRLYGHDGQGCSLSIPYTRGTNYRAYQVRYRDRKFQDRYLREEEEDKKVAERLRKLFEVGKEIIDRAPGDYRQDVGMTVAKEFHQIIHGYYHLIKHKAYEDEKERRIISVMPAPDQIQYDTTSENLIKRYIEGPSLKQLLISKSIITIGPAVFNRRAARDYIDNLVKKNHQIKPVKIVNSDKNYRRVPVSTPM